MDALDLMIGNLRKAKLSKGPTNLFWLYQKKLTKPLSVKFSILSALLQSKYLLTTKCPSHGEIKESSTRDQSYLIDNFLQDKAPLNWIFCQKTFFELRISDSVNGAYVVNTAWRKILIWRKALCALVERNWCQVFVKKNNQKFAYFFRALTQWNNLSWEAGSGMTLTFNSVILTRIQALRLHTVHACDKMIEMTSLCSVVIWPLESRLLTSKVFVLSSSVESVTYFMISETRTLRTTNKGVSSARQADFYGKKCFSLWNIYGDCQDYFI